MCLHITALLRVPLTLATSFQIPYSWKYVFTVLVV